MRLRDLRTRTAVSSPIRLFADLRDQRPVTHRRVDPQERLSRETGSSDEETASTPSIAVKSGAFPGFTLSSIVDREGAFPDVLTDEALDGLVCFLNLRGCRVLGERDCAIARFENPDGC